MRYKDRTANTLELIRLPRLERLNYYGVPSVERH